MPNSMPLMPISFTKHIHASGTLALAFYFSLNLALTLLNKLLLQQIKFPYLLTALHAGASWLGCDVLLRRSNGTGRIQRRTLRPSDHVKLVLFSILYSMNIGISNVSLHLIPLSLHQLLRATTPAITALLLRLLTQKRYTPSAYASLSLVVFGVALATTHQPRNHNKSASSSSSSSYSASLSGTLLTLLGAFLASLKSIAAAALQKDKSPPARGAGGASTFGFGFGMGMGMDMDITALQLIHYISPLASLQSLLYAWLAAELDQILPSFPPSLRVHTSKAQSGAEVEDLVDGSNMSSQAPLPLLLLLLPLLFLLLLNCITAFGLNIASFEANRRVGALGITVAANVKQVLLFAMGGLAAEGDDEWGWVRWAAGVGTTVGGSLWFAIEERRPRERKGGELGGKWPARA